MRQVILVVITVVALSGCATIGSTRMSSDYRIRAKDELRVVIWKELDEKVVVRPDGRISLPLIGEVYCKGKTPAALSKELSEGYKQNTTIIVTKTYSSKEDLKDLIGFLRDAVFFFLAAEKVTGD